MSANTHISICKYVWQKKSNNPLNNLSATCVYVFCERTCVPLHAAQGRKIKTLILPACIFHGIVLFGWSVASGLHPTHLYGVNHPAHFAFLVHRGEERTFVRRDVPQRNIHHFGAVESQVRSLNLQRVFGVLQNFVLLALRS